MLQIRMDEGVVEIREQRSWKANEDVSLVHVPRIPWLAHTLTGQPNDPPPPMYHPFASLIADYLPGSDIDRGRVWKGPIASGIMRAVCVCYLLPCTFSSLLSPLSSSSPPLPPFLSIVGTRIENTTRGGGVFNRRSDNFAHTIRSWSGADREDIKVDGIN